MKGKTHNAGGAVAVTAGFLFLKSQNLLIPGVSEVLQFAIMYPAALYGSAFPDIDHHAGAMPFSDPFSVIINKIIHIPNKIYNFLDKRKGNKRIKKIMKTLSVRHRAWQTHAIELVFLLSFLLNSILRRPLSYNKIIGLLIFVGFSFGVISHIILDMMTTAGVPTLIGTFIKTIVSKITGIKFKRNKMKLRVVPKSSVFTTGSKYESIVCKTLNVVSVILMGIILLGFFGYNITLLV